MKYKKKLKKLKLKLQNNDGKTRVKRTCGWSLMWQHRRLGGVNHRYKKSSRFSETLNHALLCHHKKCVGVCLMVGGW
jgi:hypothetical protein